MVLQKVKVKVSGDLLEKLLNVFDIDLNHIAIFVRYLLLREHEAMKFLTIILM